MQTRNRMNRGLTFVEVLIVISVISLIVSIAIPAVLSSHGASSRVVCASNLRQLGAAMHSVAAIDGSFPPGFSMWIKGPLFKDPEIRLHSYMAFMLPHLDGATNATPYRFDASFAAIENHDAIASPMPICICPSSPNRSELVQEKFVPSLLFTPSVRQNNIVKNIIGRLDAKFTSTFECAISDYSVISSVHKDVVQKLGLKERQDWGLGRTGMFPYPFEDMSELIQRGLQLARGSNEETWERRLKSTDITDGLGYTIMMAEDSGRPQRWEHGIRTELQEPIDGAGWADIRGILIVNGLRNNRLCLMQCDNKNEIYSFHPGGSNFLFADGHVDFLNASMDSMALLSFITPSDYDNN